MYEVSSGARNHSNSINLSNIIVRKINELVLEEDEKICSERIRLIKEGKCKTINSSDVEWYVCEKKVSDSFKYNSIFGKSKIRVIALTADHSIIGKLANKEASLISLKPSKVHCSIDLFQVIMGLSKEKRTLELTLLYFNLKRDPNQSPIRRTLVFEWEESKKFLICFQKHLEKYASNLIRVDEVSLD